MNNGIREQQRDVQQILFRSLIKTIPPEAILEVWNVRATGTQGTGHYVVLLNEGTHLCTCLLLINKGLICRHFFRVGTYSRHATFHISMIPNRWFLDTETINPNDLLQQYSPIPVCGKQSEDSIEFDNDVDFHHFFSIRVDSSGPQSVANSAKTMFAELFGLSRKAIDFALKFNMQCELLNILKSFIYDAQDKLEIEQTTIINNPTITKHKGRPPTKRLKSNVEMSLSKGTKRVLKDSTQVNIADDNVIDETRGRRCGNCKQFGHYAKTCQNDSV
jgi:hypothetical protein